MGYCGVFQLPVTKISHNFPRTTQKYHHLGQADLTVFLMTVWLRSVCNSIQSKINSAALPSKSYFYITAIKIPQNNKAHSVAAMIAYQQLVLGHQTSFSTMSLSLASHC